MVASAARSAGALDRPAPSQQTRAGWHVSPAVDLCAYAFSWVPIVIPMLLLADASHPYAFAVFIVTTMVTDIHRHYTLPYVYLDRDVRDRYPLRVWLLPAFFLVCLSLSPALSASERVLSAVEVTAVFAWVWLGLQLLRQDRGGSFQLRAALPCVAVPGAAAAGIGALGASTLEVGWLWLVGAAGGSLALYRLVARDAVGASASDARSSALFPLGVLAMLGVALVLPSGPTSISVLSLLNLLFFVFLVWNGYHVILQKYGILRVYSAKSGQPQKVPGWVDRLLVWSWLPLWVVWIARDQAQMVIERLHSESPGLEGFVSPLLAFCTEHFALLLALAASLAIGSAAAFLAYEWKVHRLRNMPRLGFAAGTLLFYATFFQLGIAYFYSAYAFTHGVEYMVFTWAFQRRRYDSVRDEAPILSRWLRHPLIFYGTFTGILFGVIFYARYAGIHFMTDRWAPTLFGTTLWDWARWYTMYQAMLHFYYDGFLWKMRRPELRAQL